MMKRFLVTVEIEMQTLKLTEIRTDGGTQARVSLNQDTVNEYAQQMQDGAIFPPVVVFSDGSDNWLADGFHRYFALRQNGGLEIEVEMHKGTVDDATLYAFGATARRGMTFTKEDYKNIVTRMMQHPVWSTWSTRKIAEHLGCSAMTISRVKSSLEEAPKTVSYTRNGKDKTMDISSIGKAPRAPKKQDPAPPIEDLNHSEELIDTINKLSEENDRLKDAIAVGQFDASDIEKMDVEETIKDLREQIRLKDIEIDALRESRDIHQQKAAELLKTVNSLKAKIKKMGGE
jgi:DNA-binding transcriptional regulator YhcF (GntR family)